MQVIRLSGGLGNQLFQVALSIVLSKTNLKPVGLDLAGLTFGTRKKNEVSDFKSNHFFFCDTSNPIDNILERIYKIGIINSLISPTSKEKALRGSFKKLDVQYEGNTNFNRDLVLNVDSYFVGSFISPEYWEGYTDEVLEAVRLLFWKKIHLPSPIESHILNIHIRRGDYIHNPKARSFHGICSLDYYLSSVREMLEAYPEINSIQIFSDEQIYAGELKERLRFTGLEIVLNTTLDASIALGEMSASKYFIGCNSTFSWWASVLIEGRISTFPSQWFLDPTRGIEPKKFFIGNVHTSDIKLE